MNRAKFLFVLAILFGAGAVLAPNAAACSVCFGDPDSLLSKGAVWGVIVMLVFLGTVLGGVASFFIFLARKSAATAVATGSAELREPTEKV